jgi:hypothetical protein
MAKNHIGKPAMYGGGDGPFAFVTPCRVVYYTLWETRQEADTRKAKVDRTGVEESADRGLITSLI